jgi:lipid-A-disaccharide synthase
MLSVMLSVVNDFPAYQFVIAGAQVKNLIFYKDFISGKHKIHLQ